MAVRRISLPLSHSLDFYHRLRSGFAVSKCCFTFHRRSQWNHSAAAVLKESISPGVSVNYTQLLISGKFVDTVSGKTFRKLDLRTGEVIAHVA
ncbi:hypothetical protein CRG98_038380 [Punica granatum]|uniref:Uncharacterized protein n=1 Tax=Punica granatum TaxID=22663 RepID=A0A2I0IBA2_PUNGR|nr:hypothetical protein CRG98_038380 [Punica granatum]